MSDQPVYELPDTAVSTYAKWAEKHTGRAHNIKTLGDGEYARCECGAFYWHTDIGRVTCLDCGWRGKGYQLKAQACTVCDGRVADV